MYVRACITNFMLSLGMSLINRTTSYVICSISRPVYGTASNLPLNRLRANGENNPLVRRSHMTETCIFAVVNCRHRGYGLGIRSSGPISVNNTGARRMIYWLVDQQRSYHSVCRRRADCASADSSDLPADSVALQANTSLRVYLFYSDTH